MANSKRKGDEYIEGELDVILSLVPTNQNITRLASLLDRSEKAIEIVYKIAYEKSGLSSGIQKEKIFAAKQRLGIKIGGKRLN